MHWPSKPTLAWIAALLLAGSGCALRRPGGEEAFRFDTGRLTAEDRAFVEAILEKPSAVAPLKQQEVRSSREMYAFFFDHLDFTGACARAGGDWDYTVERTEAGFRVEGEGLKMDVRQLLYDGRCWVFLCQGLFPGPVGGVKGDLLVVVHTERTPDLLVTKGMAYLRAEGMGAFAAAIFPRAVRYLMNKKGGIFVDVSTRLCERASADPAGFYREFEPVEEVDRITLGKFRDRFVE
jgi:hypothetical protein